MHPYRTVTIDTSQITDTESFHDVVAAAFGFIEGYGRNLDALVDCLRSLDNPSRCLGAVTVPPSGIIVLHLKGMADFIRRNSELASSLQSIFASVNSEGRPLFAVAYDRL